MPKTDDRLREIMETHQPLPLEDGFDPDACRKCDWAWAPSGCDTAFSARLALERGEKLREMTERREETIAMCEQLKIEKEAAEGKLREAVGVLRSTIRMVTSPNVNDRMHAFDGADDFLARLGGHDAAALRGDDDAD